MFRFTSLLLLSAAALEYAGAHMVITYPGWRGNNLITNGTLPEDNPEALGITYDNGSVTYPYGMQWMYPCGGMPQTSSPNRTLWPYGGGAISVQPGWFDGHAKAFIYVNIGIQEAGSAAPPNYSLPVVPPFQITGPNNSIYPGQFCLPQVRMPANLSLAIGDNITIQVVEAAQHGAALYSCVDVTLADPKDVEPVTPQNCYNSTDFGFNLVFTTAALTAGATSAAASSTVFLITALVTLGFAFVL